MTSHVITFSPHGYSGRLVEVEGDANRGLPSFNIVGMANKTVSEATERVRSAINNSGLSFPTSKLIINLAPAELSKQGSFLDLPIALAVLVLSNQLQQNHLNHKVFVGELSLDGHLRPIRGILNIIEAAKASGYSEIYIPDDNSSQASLISEINIYPVSSLIELILHLNHQRQLQPLRHVVKNTKTDETPLLFDQIQGQTFAKRALTIALAGHHNILISGPPGAGKTLLARSAPALLPPLSPTEQISVTKLHNLANLSHTVITERPFRSPHHTCTLPSLLGGGPHAKPGEISLAHFGILFLDELPEYPRAVLESLRQPLEDKSITISRQADKFVYPADFMLIAAMNPCPCGYYGDNTHECTCTASEIQRYRRKLSGPLLDRIDLHIHVDRVEAPNLAIKPKPSVVKNTITEAITRQKARYSPNSALNNANLSPNQITKFLTLTPTAKNLLDTACHNLNLSARSYFKIIKVSQTIADLSGDSTIHSSHVSEALSYRQSL